MNEPFGDKLLEWGAYGLGLCAFGVLATIMFVIGAAFYRLGMWVLS